MENCLDTKKHVSKHIKKFANACAKKNAAKDEFCVMKEIKDMKNNVSYFVSSLNAKELSYEL